MSENLLRKMPPPDPFQLLNTHVRVSHETVERLSIYHNLLLKWQPKINLISNDSISDIWNRHFLDSIQLLNNIPDLTSVIADIGSGAGFPGMALAICGARNIHLIESDLRKIAFLREVSRLTNTPVTLHAERVEKVTLNTDIILSRACSELGKLFEYSLPLVSHGTKCLFHKGKNYSKEICDAERNWSFEYKILPSVTDSQGVIINISNLRKRQL